MPLWTWPACRLWGAHWSQTRLNDVPNPWSPLVYAGAEPLCVQLWLHWTIIKSNSHSECSIFTAFNFVRSSVCSPMTSPTRIVVSACDELNFSFAQQRRQPARALSSPTRSTTLQQNLWSLLGRIRRLQVKFATCHDRSENTSDLSRGIDSYFLTDIHRKLAYYKLLLFHPRLTTNKKPPCRPFSLPFILGQL